MSLRPERPLSGKVALITGSARRIGREIALALADEGAHVIIHARSSRDEIDAVAKTINTSGGQATALLADITHETAVGDLVEGIHEKAGPVEILVNNAAIRGEKPLGELDLETFRSVYAVAVEGAFLLTRALIPDMVERGFGRVITIGGASAHAGVSNRVHVATAKAALVGFAKAIAVEFAQQGVTSNIVVPGKIGGPRSATAGEGGSFSGGREPLVGHQGDPRNVAEVVRLLALPAGNFITGQTIHVSGGLYLP